MVALKTLGGIALCLICTSTFAANIITRLNTQKVMEGDTVKLIVSVDEDTDGKKPDFSVLNQQFEIISTYVDERSSIINGRYTATTNWVLTMLPKQSGYLAVPPITYDGAASKPLKLHVTKRKAGAAGDEYLFVDAKLDKASVYVQEQAIYTVRIFRTNVDIYDPSYQPPTIENAAIEMLGEQRNYKQTLNGHEYDVFEFQYAVFPQKSGPLHIPAAQLQATIFRSQARGRTYDPLNGKQVRRYSPTLTLEVKAKPESYPADQPWLPASALELQESWSPDRDQIAIGEPVTRTVTMTAKGVLPTILPALPVTELDSVKVYPEQADTRSDDTDNGVISQRLESQALIATQAGDITLPAVEVTWWDVDSDSIKVTSLPARRIRFTGKASTVQTDGAAVAAPSFQADAPPPALSDSGSLNRTWQWIAFAALGLWLATLAALAWVLMRRKAASPEQATDSTSSPFSANRLRNAQKTFQQACEKQDPKAVRSSLIEVFQQHYRDSRIRNLSDVLQRANNDALAAAIQELDSHLYKDGPASPWQADRLQTLVKSALSTPVTHSKDSALEPLYPAG